MGRRLVVMMFLMPPVFVMTESTHAVVYLNWRHGMFIIRVVQTLFGLLGSSCLNLRWLFVAFAIGTVVDFVLHHEWSHLCLPLFVCPVCHFTYITQSCLQMHITEIHRGLSSAQQSLSFNYNFKG